jgi:hypothetical protein
MRAPARPWGNPQVDAPAQPAAQVTVARPSIAWSFLSWAGIGILLVWSIPGLLLLWVLFGPK